MSILYAEISPHIPIPNYLLSSPTGSCATQSVGKQDGSLANALYELGTVFISGISQNSPGITKLVFRQNETSMVLASVSVVEPDLLQRLGVAVQQEDEVSQYLRTYPDIAEVVPEAVDAVRRHIRNAYLLLGVYSDPEIDDRYLVLYVRVPVYDETFMTRIEEAEAEFIERLSNSRGWLQLTTDFQPPETIDAL